MRKSEGERIRELLKNLDNQLKSGGLTKFEIRIASIKCNAQLFILRLIVWRNRIKSWFREDEILENVVYILWSFDAGCSSIEGVYHSFELAENDLNELVNEINARLLITKPEWETLFEKDDNANYDEYTLLSFSSKIRTIAIRGIEMNKNYGNIKGWYE